MKSELAKAEKYPVIEPQLLSSADYVIGSTVGLFALSLLVWLFYSAFYRVAMDIQLGGIVMLLFVNAAFLSKSFVASQLDLKAKGLDIADPQLNAIMPWDWLKVVEIRQKKFSFIPNYVYFGFNNGQDVLILWEDVRATMDSTTLISCVRTWAPHAKIVGDAKLTKSESIATYTELWLKDMSSSKTEKRLRIDQTLSEGTVLNGSYKIERVLSGGGQGTAYLATFLPQYGIPELPPQVVVKELILPANDRGLQKATSGLIKEVTILRRITHPRIVRLYDFFIEDMRGYLVIEYIDGQTLRQLVSQKGLMPERTVAKIGASLCEALSYLHSLSPPIIHGDVTPDNVMLEKNGDIKLLDFDASQELTRNKTNTVVGKHSYMSPEQFKGAIENASDVYALGCTLHFLLTGNDPEPISESRPVDLNSSVSAKMNHIVSHATKLDRVERYSDLNEMRRQLEQLR